MKWWLGRLCRILAEVIGDRDYDVYCAHVARRHPGQQPLPPGEFYVRRLQDKYARPSSCC